jgi:hypothetical protein
MTSRFQEVQPLSIQAQLAGALKAAEEKAGE